MNTIYVNENNIILDIYELIEQNIDIMQTQIFFYGYHLTGGTESTSPFNPLFFGTLDSKDSNLGLDTLKPIYQLISEVDSSYTESKADNTDSSNTLSTLHIFLNNSILTILNYSLLDSSLNIKLECKSIESKAILEREKAKRKRFSNNRFYNKHSILTPNIRR